MASDAVAAAAVGAAVGLVELIRFGARTIGATTAVAGGRGCAVCERVGRGG